MNVCVCKYRLKVVEHNRAKASARAVGNWDFLRFERRLGKNQKGNAKKRAREQAANGYHLL
jgi:hypothetical protein